MNSHELEHAKAAVDYYNSKIRKSVILGDTIKCPVFVLLRNKCQAIIDKSKQDTK